MAMMYDPVIDSFLVYESAPIQESPVKFKLPLEDVELPWASSIVNGNPVPKDNISELRTPADPSYLDVLDRMAESHSEETVNNENLNDKTTKKTITSTLQKKNALVIMNNLVKRGYLPHVAAGIVGNLMAESGLNPANYVKSDVGKPGGGLAAWRDDLFRNLQSSAKSQNIPWTNIDFLLNYLHNLLNLNSTQMNEVRDKLNKAKTPYEASEAWAYYEKYAGYNHSLASAKSWQKQNKWTDAQTSKWIKDEHAKRGGFAKEFYELWKNQKA